MREPMYKYLIDIEKQKVLLMVEGPISVKPGQKIVLHSKAIKISKARYDAKADEITEITESTQAKNRRTGAKAAAARRAEFEALAREFAVDLNACDARTKRMFRAILSAPRGLLLEAAGKEEG
jgi:hypothetical protein